jgi:hypothetical protein
MPRTSLCLAALAVFAFPCRADETVSTPATLTRLNVSPAPAPKPALRYLLLPELQEMNPGNPVQNYMKCFMEQHKFFFDKAAFERREKLLTMPLRELPAKELTDYGSFPLRQADWAARLDTPDWQFLLKMRADGVSAAIPDVQAMRPLAKALKVRFRAEVALGRFDDALKTAKTMFAMSRHLALHPIYVSDLVGIAIAATALGPLEEMLEQPGCPNLYWALTNLPVPLVPIDKGSEGERVGIMSEFHDFNDSDPMTADQIKKFIEHMDRILIVPEKPSIRSSVDARAKDEKMVNAARRRLVEHGLAEKRVLRFPAEQVILLDEKREYEVRRDETMKLLNLPVWQVQSLVADIAKANKAPTIFAELLVEGIYNVRKAQVRLDRRIALLRHVEALRLYASEHNGSLPAKLSDVSVPLPDDPSTGKPFGYEVTGNTAHLRAIQPFAEDKNPIDNLQYEVTLQK